MVKRLSTGALALLATLLLAIPMESQAFFGFFGFSFGFGGGWGGNWWGPGYWYRPWYHRYWGYPYWYRGYGHYPYAGLYPFYSYPYTLAVPAVTVPETPKSK